MPRAPCASNWPPPQHISPLPLCLRSTRHAIRRRHARWSDRRRRLHRQSTFTSCTFVNASVGAIPELGGALSVTKGRVIIENSAFGGRGGHSRRRLALTQADGVADVTVMHTTFSNVATQGGAVLVEGHHAPHAADERVRVECCSYTGGALQVDRGFVSLSTRRASLPATRPPQESRTI